MMQYSVGVEYAFHSLFYMIDIPKGKTIGIKELSKLNNISESYLSKVFTKLKKAGIVRSVSGVNGGYEFSKSPELISFWDIIEAIEGTSYLFQCAELRQDNIFNNENESFEKPCLIKSVIWEAEELMREQLRSKSLLWLSNEAKKDFTNDKKDLIKEWVESSK